MCGVIEAPANVPCTGHPKHSLFQQGGKIHNKAYQSESIRSPPYFSRRAYFLRFSLSVQGLLHLHQFYHTLAPFF